ncbi:ORF6N domain-containing protein [bacterium]|nr:ORF6N domain-containing protein [bacterium]
MKEIKLITKENIQTKIHSIRGVQVILDKELAVFYDVKPIRLREQVKRNIKRFPSDFMFQLTEKEVELKVSHFAIPSKQHLGGALPYVFTEQGVATISSVLTSEKAIEVNIQIMRAFVSMRRFFTTNAQIFKRLHTLELKQGKTDKKIEHVFNALESKEIKPKQGLFFDGQIFDAYQFVSDLIRTAQKSIILIDNYIDDTVLILLSKRRPDVMVTIFSKTISKQMKLDIEKYNTQYPAIEIKSFCYAHDRFLIIDDKEVYHFGASLKDLGKKWFAFSKFDKEAFNLLSRLKLKD